MSIFLSFEIFFADTMVYIYQSKSNHLINPFAAHAWRGVIKLSPVHATSVLMQPLLLLAA